VRNGVLEAGGFPLEFPAMSLGETLMRPTTMLYRNLASMDVEESIRANPLDGVVLLMGCDKTTPSLIMGASSVGLPTLGVSGAPCSRASTAAADSRLRHQRVVDVRGPARGEDHDRRVPRGRVVHAPLARPLHDHGHGVHHGFHGRRRLARPARQRGDPRGRCAALRARAHGGTAHRGNGEGEPRHREDPDPQAFENAIRVNAAIGGSTNAVIHLIAIARRIGVDLALEDFDRLGRGVHTLVNLMPNGKHLMEDFYYAGGLPVVIRELGKRGCSTSRRSLRTASRSGRTARTRAAGTAT